SPDFDYYREKRNVSPVWCDPQSNIWNVYRYADAAAVLGDFSTFSSDFSPILQNHDHAELAEGNILVTDPPRHQQLRQLVSQAFSPRAIAQMQGRIAAIADQLLDRIEHRAQIELIGDFAYPLPVTVISEMLGVPTRDRARFRRWANALLDTSLESGDDRARLD